MTDDLFTCPVCHDVNCVPPVGNKNSPILIVAEFPGEDELKKGRPLIGATGDVLRKELGKLGLDINRLRLCNLWQHKPSDNEECFQSGMKTVIMEAREKQAILLLGSETVKTFTGENVSNVCGLRVQSNYFSAPIIIACVNPAQVFHASVGELRLALAKFVRAVEGIIE